MATNQLLSKYSVSVYKIVNCFRFPYTMTLPENNSFGNTVFILALNLDTTPPPKTIFFLEKRMSKTL